MTVDGTALAKGAFRGLLVLVFGSLVVPAVARLAPVIAPVWLSAVAVVAFAIAAAHQGLASRPVAQGVGTAVGAYLLVVPLLLLTPGRDAGQLLMTGGTAVVTGAVTGAVVALVRRGSRRAE